MTSPKGIRRVACGRRGLTLIELVITLSLMALVVAIVAPAVGSLTGVKLRTSASQLAGAIRFGYDLAARRNVTLRLVLDLDERAYWLEATGDPFRLEREKTEVRDGIALEKEEKKKSRFLSRAEIESGDFWQPRPPAGFVPLEGGELQKVVLEEDTFIQDVWVAHQSDRLTAGKAYLYFFPSGLTEKAVIHLGDEHQNAFSLLVEPLLGTVRLEAGYLEEAVE